MRAHPSGQRWLRMQAGFSMIEMLMTAFIMAVGILGLTMLLVMSLKGSRGGRSLTTAVLVGDNVMDRVEMEGRLSWLNATGNAVTPSRVTDLPNVQYISIADKGTFTETFNSKGSPTNPTSSDPVEQVPFFTVATTRNAFTLVDPAAPATRGALSDFTVVVRFSDQTDQANAPIVRQVTLTRRVIHGV